MSQKSQLSIQREVGTVSRQMSPEELSIEGEINSYKPVTANSAPALSSRTGFDIMADEMRMREMQIGDLQNRQRAAYAASARRELHEQTKDRERLEQQSLSAIDQINKRLVEDRSLSMKDATNEAIQNDPSLASNPVFMETHDKYSKLFESETNREKRIIKDKIETIGLSTKLLDADRLYEWSKENKDAMRQLMDAEFQSKLSGERRKILEDNLNTISAQIAIRNIESINRFGSDDNQKSGYLQAKLSQIIPELKDTNGIVRFSKDPSGGNMLMAMLGNESVVNKLLSTPEDKKRFVEFASGERFDPLSQRSETIPDEEIGAYFGKMIGKFEAIDGSLAAKFKEQFASRSAKTQSSQGAKTGQPTQSGFSDPVDMSQFKNSQKEFLDDSDSMMKGIDKTGDIPAQTSEIHKKAIYRLSTRIVEHLRSEFDNKIKMLPDEVKSDKDVKDALTKLRAKLNLSADGPLGEIAKSQELSEAYTIKEFMKEWFDGEISKLSEIIIGKLQNAGSSGSDVKTDKTKTTTVDPVSKFKPRQ